MENFFKSKTFKYILATIGSFVIILLVFKAGEFVGFRKASFSYRWAENYHLNFGAPRGGILRDLVQDDYINAEGTAGSIIKIDNNTLIIKGKDNMEKTVLISNQTTIRSGMTTIGPSALKVDDKVIIIGSPNNANGQIEAKFIRLFFAK